MMTPMYMYICMRHSTAALKNTHPKETYYTDQNRPTPTKETYSYKRDPY